MSGILNRVRRTTFFSLKFNENFRDCQSWKVTIFIFLKNLKQLSYGFVEPSEGRTLLTLPNLKLQHKKKTVSVFTQLWTVKRHTVFKLSSCTLCDWQIYLNLLSYMPKSLKIHYSLLQDNYLKMLIFFLVSSHSHSWLVSRFYHRWRKLDYCLVVMKDIYLITLFTI